MAEIIFDFMEKSLREYLNQNKENFSLIGKDIEDSHELRIGLYTPDENVTIIIDALGSQPKGPESSWEWDVSILKGKHAKNFFESEKQSYLVIDKYIENLINTQRINYISLITRIENFNQILRYIPEHSYEVFHKKFLSPQRIQYDDNFCCVADNYRQNEEDCISVMRLNPRKIFRLACYYYVSFLYLNNNDFTKNLSFYNFFLMFVAMKMSYVARYEALGFSLPAKYSSLGHIKHSLIDIFGTSIINAQISNDFKSNLEKITEKQENFKFMMSLDIHGSYDFCVKVADGLCKLKSSNDLLDNVIRIAKIKGLRLNGKDYSHDFPVNFVAGSTMFINYEFPYSLSEPEIFHGGYIPNIRFCAAVLEAVKK